MAAENLTDAGCAPGPSLLGTGEVGLRVSGAPGPSLLGTGETGSLITAAGFVVGVFSRYMKGQRIRYQQTGEFHFLTFSCYRRRPYLATIRR